MSTKNIKYIIFIALLLLYCCCYGFHIINYETNDDSLMNMIASGYWLGVSSEYLIQINVVLGRILTFFYTHFPSFNWYFLMLLGTQFIAWNLILNALFQRTYLLELLVKSRAILFISITIALFFIVPLLLRIQFTSTAFLIGFAGILQLWKSEKWSFGRQCIVFCCIVLASLLRFQAGLFVLATCFFFIDYQRITRYISVLMSIVIAIAFFKVMHGSAYNSVSPKFEAWQQANEQIMGKINLEDSENLTKTGFSDTDWQVFKSWFWFDSLVFNKEKIINAAATLKSSASLTTTLKRAARIAMDQYVSLIILATLFLLFYQQKKSRILKLQSISFFVFIVFVLLYLIVFQRIPTRVTTPILLISILYLLLNIDYQSLIHNDYFTILNKYNKILFILILINFFHICMIIEENKIYRTAFTTHQTIFGERPGKLFLGLGSAVPMEGMPVELNPVSYSSFNFLPLGWSEFTPPQEQFFKKWHIAHLPFELLTNDILIVGQQEGFDEHLKAFYQAHYNQKITFLNENIGIKDIFIQRIKAE